MCKEKKMGQNTPENSTWNLTKADILVTQKFRAGAVRKTIFSLAYKKMTEQKQENPGGADEKNNEEGKSSDPDCAALFEHDVALFNKDLLQLSFEYNETFTDPLLDDRHQQQSTILKTKQNGRRTSRSWSNLVSETHTEGKKKVSSEISIPDGYKPWRSSEVLPLPRYRSLLDQNPKDIEYIDSHCHLDFLFSKLSFNKTFEDFQAQHQDTFLPNYGGCVAIYCNPQSFTEKSMWMPHLECPKVWASFGCHPHHANNYDSWAEQALQEALTHHRVVALGEIGLDYSYKNNVKPEVQHTVFRSQLKIALKLGLPLVIHCRDAFQDTIDITKELVPKEHRIHLHCFTGTWEEACQWFDHFPQLCIGLTPLVTFNSATIVHDVARRVPLDRLLLETDAPFFVPAGCKSPRLKYSHPGLAIHTAAQVAALKGTPLDTVLRATRQNTSRIYLI